MDNIMNYLSNSRFTFTQIVFMISEVEIAVNLQSTLGEGAIWDDKNKCLYWVDILKGLVHKYDLIKANHETKEIGGFVGSVVPVNQNEIVLLVNREFVRYNWSTGEKSILGNVEKDRKGNRFNDGKCDPAGRFWAGTMALDEAKGAGGLYCLNNDLSIDKKLKDISISNGIVWTSDQQTMYYIDTPTMEVWAFDYDITSGDITNKKVVVKVDKKEGFPDGMTIDHEDKLWIAHWGGKQIARWDPKNGEKLLSIPVPVSHITSCAFGGKNLDQLYITCAREGLSSEQLEQEPLAGSLFVYDTKGAYKGVPANKFILN